jgi:hypothetical protein
LEAAFEAATLVAGIVPPLPAAESTTKDSVSNPMAISGKRTRALSAAPLMKRVYRLAGSNWRAGQTKASRPCSAATTRMVSLPLGPISVKVWGVRVMPLRRLLNRTTRG